MTLGEKCPEFRECILCGAKARFNVQKLRPDEPVIVSLHLSFYVRDSSGGRHVACKRIYVCDSDLRKMFAWRNGQQTLSDAEFGVGVGEAITLAESVLDTLEDPYKGRVMAKNAIGAEIA